MRMFLFRGDDGTVYMTPSQPQRLGRLYGAPAIALPKSDYRGIEIPDDDAVEVSVSFHPREIRPVRSTTASRKTTRAYSETDVNRIVGRYLETLRGALRQCKVSQNQVARETRIPQPVLSRFINGKRSLKLETVAVLADYLGFEFRRTRRVR